jgi:hypothetical protein
MNTWVDWIALIASLATIISVCVNVIQRQQSTTFKRMLKDKMQAEYNNLFQIAQRRDQIERIRDDASANPGTDMGEALDRAVEQAWVICGFVDSGRNSIIAFCREHLGFIPRYEHPAQPLEKLASSRAEA